MPKKSAGTFYSLQDAYDKGLLTVEDLQSIAYYHNDDAMPVYPETLSEEIEKAVKETRASDLRSMASSSNATADDVTILAYYGTYNGSVAVMIADSFTTFGQATWTETVEGLDFHYGDGNKIFIWAKGTEANGNMTGVFYSLQEAYGQGFLTTEDLHGIASYYNNNTAPIANLSADVQKAIKMARVEKLHNLNSNPILKAMIDDVTILKYLGTYGNATAVIITDIYSVYGDGGLAEFVVEGATFYNYNAPEIMIWIQ